MVLDLCLVKNEPVMDWEQNTEKIKLLCLISNENVIQSVTFNSGSLNDPY